MLGYPGQILTPIIVGITPGLKVTDYGKVNLSKLFQKKIVWNSLVILVVQFTKFQSVQI